MATARATKRCSPRLVPAAGRHPDHALKHLRSWMQPQRRAHRPAAYWPRRAQPRHPAAAGRGRRDRAVELSGQPEPRAADLHLRRRQPRDGQDERELAPPGAAADRDACRPTSRPRSCSSSTRPAASASSSPSCRSTTCCSPARAPTGRAVMAAAAQNLCPVTLELGGKAPAIVCDDFRLRLAAERILFVKCLNAGQICTTVDHACRAASAASMSSCDSRARSCRALPEPRHARLHLDHRPAARSSALSTRWTMRASAAPR